MFALPPPHALGPPPRTGRANSLLTGSSLLWDASYDEDGLLLRDSNDESTSSSTSNSTNTSNSKGKTSATSCSSAHFVTIDRTAKLYIRVNESLCLTNFDPTTPEGGKGPIEESGVVQIGDTLEKVDDTDVRGKDVREVMQIIRGAADDSVILTFVSPRQDRRAQGDGVVHLTEQRT